MIQLLNIIKVNIASFFDFLKKNHIFIVYFSSIITVLFCCFFIVYQNNEVIYQNNQIAELNKIVEILNNKIITQNESLENIETKLRELSDNYKAHLENIYSNQGVFDDKLEALNSRRLRSLTVRRVMAEGFPLALMLVFVYYLDLFYK
jgi:uncharacterized membrane protein affecting hemolysin expression